MAIVSVDRQRKALQGALNSSGDASSDPVERSITVDDIHNFSPQMNSYQREIYDQMDRYNRATGRLPNSTYFPGGDANINKGSYSGPHIGNVPIFTPTQLVPYGVFGARQDNLKAAAAQKAKGIEDFFALAKPPETSRFSVQAELDDAYFNGLKQWVPALQQRYGSNWAQASKTDTQFQGWQQSMNTVAKYNTGLVEKVAQLEALDKDPNFVLAPTTRKYANAVIAGYGGLANSPWNPDSYKLGDNLLRMNAETDLDVAVNNSLKEYTDQVYSKNPSHYENGIYDVWTEMKVHGMSADQIDQMAEGIWKNSYGASSEYFSKEDIANRLRALYPIRAEKEVKFQTNQFSNAGGQDITYDPTSINPEAVPVTYKGSENGVTTYDGQTLNKPVTLNIPNATTAVDPATGEVVPLAGNSKVQIGKTFNILVTKDGAPVDGNKVPEGQDPKNYRYETYAAGTVDANTTSVTNYKYKPTDRDANGARRESSSETTRTNQTIWIPVSAIQNGLTTFNSDGTYKKGVRTDIQKNNAGQRTQQLHASQPQNAPTAETFDQKWSKLPSGGTMVGPDGKTYTKK